MRITFVVPTLNAGGTEIQLIAQANELSSRGISVQVIVLSDNDTLKQDLRPEIYFSKLGVKELKTLNKKSIVRILGSIKKSSKVINSFRPDHIIANLQPSFLLVRILKSFKLIRGKIWIYHHSTEYLNAVYDPRNKRIKKLYNFLILKALSSKNEHHLMISKAVKKDIEGNEEILHSSLLYNSVKPPNLEVHRKKELLNKFQLHDKKYIIIPGTLHPRKGHLFFLQTVSDLIKKYKIRVIIVGYGILENDIKKYIIAQQLGENITLTGKLKNANLIELVASAYLCVIPSIREGLGNVAIEALAVGTTVLCSDAGGLPEIITDQITGYIFKKEDSIDLFEKFEDIIAHKKRILSPEILKKEYLSRFTTKSQIDYLLKLMESDKSRK